MPGTEPYRGLEAFHLEHSDIFFGREAEVCELETRLRQREDEGCAFVAVIGASGSGKSSLVRAGLQANLTRYNLDETIREWRSTVMLPAETKGQPLLGLIRTLSGENALPELAQAGLSETDIVESLKEAPATAIRTVFKPAFARASESAGGNVKLLINIDQFEEIFTDKRIGEEEREHFLFALEALAQSGRCWVVVTMRSDFYPVAQKSESFLRLKGDKIGETGYLDLLAPGPEALRRIITEPARMAGLRFEKRTPELGGQSLVGKILEDAKGQPDMLPLLSDLLLKLYQKRTPENLITFAALRWKRISRQISGSKMQDESFGDENRTGLEGALSTRADKEFDKLSDDQKATCPEILHALVTVEADADVRRRASLQALRDTPQKTALVDAFIEARLLTADGPTVSLAHEALLRKWDLIADWVRDNRQHLRIRSRVEQAMRRWQNRDQHSTLLLPEGLDLEEGMSLLRDSPHLLAGSEYEPVRDYISQSQRHHQARQRRASLIRRVVTVSLLALTGMAVWRTFDSNQQRDEAWSNEARGWMLRAEVAEKEDHRYPSTLLYAARAIGFDAVGRDTKTGKTPLDYVNDWIPVATSEDKTPRLWTSWNNKSEYETALKWIKERPSYLPVWSSELRNSPVTDLIMSPHGRYLAVSATDGSLQLWDFSQEENPQTIETETATIHDLAFHPHGTRLAFAGANKVRIWNLESQGYVQEHETAVTALAYNASGQILAGAASNGSILLWKGETTSTLQTGQNKPASSLVFSPDDSALAAVYPETGIRLFFHHYEKPHLSWSGHERNDATAVAIGPEGKKLVIGHADGLVSLWETASARLHGQIVPQQRHDGPVLALDFRHDGQQIASASADGTVRLWKLNVNVPVVEATLVGHTSEVNGVTYVPGGNLLASAGADGSAKIWNVSGRVGEDLNLHPYLTEDWYQFDPQNQEAKWNTGKGFLNLPSGSAVATWRENQGEGLFVRLLENRNWPGATLVASDAEKQQLAKSLATEGEEAASQNQLNLSRLRLAQLKQVGAEFDIATLTEKLGSVASEGGNFTNGDGMDLIWCPAGEFMMGESDNPGAYYRHKVILSHGFWIGKYEVTQAQYEAVVGTNSSTYRNPHAYLEGQYTAEEWTKVAPAENMDWNEAMEFCRKLTDRARARGTIPLDWEYTLPTEAQWEYASRAGTDTTWSFGNDDGELHKHGNYNDISGNFTDNDTEHDDGHEYTAPVGSYLPNPWKIHDMHGNVREWCRDSIDLQNADYPAGPVSDRFVSRGPGRVSRGGGYGLTAADCRSARRGASQPSNRSFFLGLRPCLVPSRTVQPNQGQ